MENPKYALDMCCDKELETNIGKIPKAAGSFVTDWIEDRR